MKHYFLDDLFNIYYETLFLRIIYKIYYESLFFRLIKCNQFFGL